jgi:hypothetical protein
MSEITAAGFKAIASRYYHGRWECFFWGRNGHLLLKQIRKFFEHDDIIYTNSEIDSSVDDGCQALLTTQQLCWIILINKL